MSEKASFGNFLNSRELHDLLNGLLAKINTANDAQQLVHIIDDFYNGSPSLEVNYKNHQISMLVGLAFAVISIAVIVVNTANPNYINDALGIWGVAVPTIISALCLLVPFYKIRQDKNKILDSSKQILVTKVKLDYGLNEEAPDAMRNHQNSFAEFQRGNYSRDFNDIHSGYRQAYENAYHYYYYNFHYVDAEQKTYTEKDSKGNRKLKTKTVYHHFDRYGILVNGQFFNEIDIVGFHLDTTRRQAYQPASIDFNKSFKVYCSDQMEASKLLKPAVVELFLKLRASFPNLNISFDHIGRLCIAFSRRDSLDFSGLDAKLTDKEAFKQQLLEPYNLPAFDELFSFLDNLMRLTDNNFRSTPWT